MKSAKVCRSVYEYEMQLKNSTNDKSFRTCSWQEERSIKGGKDGAKFFGNAENQNTNLLHIWHKQHTDQEPKLKGTIGIWEVGVEKVSVL